MMMMYANSFFLYDSSNIFNNSHEDIFQRGLTYSPICNLIKWFTCDPQFLFLRFYLRKDLGYGYPLLFDLKYKVAIE